MECPFVDLFWRLLPFVSPSIPPPSGFSLGKGLRRRMTGEVKTVAFSAKAVRTEAGELALIA